MPTRRDTPGTVGGGVPSSNTPTSSPPTRSAPSWPRSMPKAWQSLAGPLQRSRSRRAAGPRAARISSRPPSGARARSRTAELSPTVAAHGVGTEVHAVGEVHVQVPGRTEHDLVAGRGAPEPVAGRVLAYRRRPRPRRSAPPGRPAPAACSAAPGATIRLSRAKNDRRDRAFTDGRGPPPGGRRTPRAAAAVRRRAASAPAGPPGDRHPGLEQGGGVGPEAGRGRDQRRPASSPSSIERRTRAPTTAWASRNGMPARDQVLGQVGGRGRRARRRRPAMRVGVEGRRRPAARSCAARAEADLVERRRTAAPCPPGGRGCRPAAGP